MTGLPFEHLNLRRNPFGEFTLEQRAQVAVADRQRFLEFLKQPRAVLQFIGHSGRGKTTHIAALRAHFPDAPYIHLKEDEPIPAIPEAELLFLDESQRFGCLGFARLMKRQARFVLGTHRDHRRACLWAGRPFLSHLISGLNVEKLRQVVEARIEFVRRGTGPVPWIEESTLSSLIEQHGDNIRAIEGDLYHRIQAMASPQAL